MLAKQLLFVFEKPSIFQQFHLEIFLATLSAHKADLLLVHFQFSPTLHLRSTVNFLLIHKRGYYS